MKNIIRTPETHPLTWRLRDDKQPVWLDEYRSKKNQRLVFIHGKGEGVLRNALLKELKSKYGSCVSQDASFREYGFGALLVIIK